MFPETEDEMCGLEWGRLFETYHKIAYDPAKVWARVKSLYADDCVRNRRGVFEFVLGGEIFVWTVYILLILGAVLPANRIWRRCAVGGLLVMVLLAVLALLGVAR